MVIYVRFYTSLITKAWKVTENAARIYEEASDEVMSRLQSAIFAVFSIGGKNYLIVDLLTY